MWKNPDPDRNAKGYGHLEIRPGVPAAQKHKLPSASVTLLLRVCPRAMSTYVLRVLPLPQEGNSPNGHRWVNGWVRCGLATQ